MSEPFIRLQVLKLSQVLALQEMLEEPGLIFSCAGDVGKRSGESYGCDLGVSEAISTLHFHNEEGSGRAIVNRNLSWGCGNKRDSLSCLYSSSRIVLLLYACHLVEKIDPTRWITLLITLELLDSSMKGCLKEHLQHIVSILQFIVSLFNPSEENSRLRE
jgi:hypothetical protein